MKNSNSSFSIVVALNDVPTLTIASYHLERFGYIVNTVQNTDTLLNTIERIEPNMLLLDEDLVGQHSPLNICTLLKNNTRTSNIKIIYASKNSDLENKNFNATITKPFVPSELVKKVKELAEVASPVSFKKTVSFLDIEMNLSTFRVLRGNRSIHLGPNEFKILQCFLEHPGKILSREHIMNYVWGHSSQVEPRTIDVHINRLRLALKNNDEELPLIKTVRSSGYSLTVPRELVRA